MAGFEEFINNPMTMMGLGILGGNYGRNSRDAFSNSMQGGLAGMQMGQLSSMRRKQQEREQAEFELKQKQYEAMKQQARMQATAFGLDPNMFDDSNDVISFYNAQKGTGTQQNLAYYNSPQGMAQIQALSKKYGIPPADIIKMGSGSTTINLGDSNIAPNAIVPVETLDNFRNEAGDVPKYGTTQAQLIAGTQSGKIKMKSAADVAADRKVEGGVAVLDSMSNILFGEGEQSGILTDVNTLADRAGVAKDVMWNKVTQEDPRYETLMRLQEGTLAPLVKAFGESGALATEDVNRAEEIMVKLFPFPDSERQARSLMDELYTILSRGTKNSNLKADIKTKRSPPPEEPGIVLDPVIQERLDARLRERNGN